LKQILYLVLTWLLNKLGGGNLALLNFMITLVNEFVVKAMMKEACNTPSGSFVEIGVYQGGTAQHITSLAEQQGRDVFLYDTFTGIPHKDIVDVHEIGDFTDTSFELISDLFSYARVIPGIFPNSAVEMDHVAFVHLDCDQYRSIIESVNYLKPLMVKGGVMWFDDYGLLAGATKAVHELFGENIETITGKAVVRF